MTMMIKIPSYHDDEHADNDDYEDADLMINEDSDMLGGG